jgi:CRP/FNR family transcriptional regulator, cyclic AMP receptor protein
MQILLPKGAILFREHDAGDGVLVICSGQVELSCTSREGRVLILKVAVPGDVLRLGAVVSSSRFEQPAETIEPVQVKKIR